MARYQPGLASLPLEDYLVGYYRESVPLVAAAGPVAVRRLLSYRLEFQQSLPEMFLLEQQKLRLRFVVIPLAIARCCYCYLQSVPVLWIDVRNRPVRDATRAVDVKFRQLFDAALRRK